MSWETTDTDRLGIVVSADGELFELVRRDNDILVQGAHRLFRVPGYVVQDLGAGNAETGFEQLVDVLTKSELADGVHLHSLQVV